MTLNCWFILNQLLMIFADVKVIDGNETLVIAELQTSGVTKLLREVKEEIHTYLEGVYVDAEIATLHWQGEPSRPLVTVRYRYPNGTDHTYEQEHQFDLNPILSNNKR